MPTSQRIVPTSSSNMSNINNNNNNKNYNNNGSSSPASQNQNYPTDDDSVVTVTSSNMKLVSKRLASFKDSPPEVKGQKKQLAAAGFFYTGRGDVVECAFCSGKLHKGKILSGEPMVEHARFFGGCSYVKRDTSECGKERKAGNGEDRGKIDDKKQLIIDDEQLDSDSLLRCITRLKEENDAMRGAMTCIVCRTASVHTLLLPCQHLVCCDKCSLSAKQCPKCQGRISQKIPTFMV